MNIAAMVVIVFAIKVEEKVVRIIETGRVDAMRAFAPHERDPRYSLWAVTPRTRRIEGAERWLPEKDRARGASTHLKGTRSKEWRGGEIVCGVVVTRIA